MMKFSFLPIVLVSLFLASCSTLHFPGVHRITVQQGNVITQSMIDKLKPGMTRRQVQYVLGNPVVDDQLNKNRWDYIYTIDVPGYDPVNRKLQVFFIDERLSYFEGDFVPTENKTRADSNS